MIEPSQSENDPEMLEEYDSSGGVRRRYVGRFAQGANVAVLDPDVAEVFPDSESVNAALRARAELFKSEQRRCIGSNAFRRAA
jgi:hypothetical protein